jgi:acrylyl-CoA reductase (NADPH)
MSFSAVVARDGENGVSAKIDVLTPKELPKEPVLVQVSHSALNYKDALALCGNRNKIMKTLPFVPGIDLAGTVIESEDPSYSLGESVLATGWGLGERQWGGFSQFARLRPEWITRMPEGLNAKHAMAFGTAGLTAMACVEAIEQHGVRPKDGEVLVTGASGGVGSIAIMVLSALGYSAVASTGRSAQPELLQLIGATRIVPRSDFNRDPKSLEKESWAAAIDTVGSRTLATVIAQLRYGGIVAACGLAGGHELPSTVMPFILRGIRLQGVDSVYVPAGRRVALWRRLAELVPLARVESIIQEVRLAEVIPLAERMLAGQLRGRAVVILE